MELDLKAVGLDLKDSPATEGGPTLMTWTAFPAATTLGRGKARAGWREGAAHVGASPHTARTDRQMAKTLA